MQLFRKCRVAWRRVWGNVLLRFRQRLDLVKQSPAIKAWCALKALVVEVFKEPSKAQLKEAADYFSKLSQTAAIAFGAQVGSVQLGLMKPSFMAVAVAIELLALFVGFFILSAILIRRSE